MGRAPSLLRSSKQQGDHKRVYTISGYREGDAVDQVLIAPDRRQMRMGKRYLIVKIAENIGHVLSVIPLPGMFTLQAAEQVVREIITADPSERVMIQEVGAA